MKVKLKPIVRKIINELERQGCFIRSVRGSHIAINKDPKLKRPIIIPNKKELSPGVKKSLIENCKDNNLEFEKIKTIID